MVFLNFSSAVCFEKLFTFTLGREWRWRPPQSSRQDRAHGKRCSGMCAASLGSPHNKPECLPHNPAACQCAEAVCLTAAHLLQVLHGCRAKPWAGAHSAAGSMRAHSFPAWMSCLSPCVGCPGTSHQRTPKAWTPPAPSSGDHVWNSPSTTPARCGQSALLQLTLDEALWSGAPPAGCSEKAWGERWPCDGQRSVNNGLSQENVHKRTLLKHWIVILRLVLQYIMKNL